MTLRALACTALGGGGLEAGALPRFGLAPSSNVEGADRGHLRVAARGLAVHQENDRLALADHLDPAERDPVGDDVMAPRVDDRRPPAPGAPPVAVARHLLGAAPGPPAPEMAPAAAPGGPRRPSGAPAPGHPRARPSDTSSGT